MGKAIAVQTMFLIAVTVIFLFFTIAIFMGWIKLSEDVTNPVVCNTKLLNYCAEWSRTDYQKIPSDWGEEAPGCVKQGIIPTMEKCKTLLQQK